MHQVKLYCQLWYFSPMASVCPHTYQEKDLWWAQKEVNGDPASYVRIIRCHEFDTHDPFGGYTISWWPIFLIPGYQDKVSWRQNLIHDKGYVPCYYLGERQQNLPVKLFWGRVLIILWKMQLSTLSPQSVKKFKKLVLNWWKFGQGFLRFTYFYSVYFLGRSQCRVRSLYPPLTLTFSTFYP